MCGLCTSIPSAWPYLKEAFAAPTWSSWVLAIVACWAGKIALRTMRAIQLQASAQMNADRAWVLIEKFGDPPPLIETVDLLAPGIVWKVRIAGNTPAQIFREHYRCRIVPVAPETNPPQPSLEWPLDYGPESSGYLPDVVVRAPGDYYFMNISLESGVLTGLEFVQLRDSKAMLCAYGRIDYVDAFGREGMTKFCATYKMPGGAVLKSPDGVVLNPPGFHIGNPPGFNEAT